MPEINTTVPSLRVDTPPMLPTPLGVVTVVQFAPIQFSISKPTAEILLAEMAETENRPCAELATPLKVVPPQLSVSASGPHRLQNFSSPMAR